MWKQQTAQFRPIFIITLVNQCNLHSLLQYHLLYDITQPVLYHTTGGTVEENVDYTYTANKY